MLKVGSNDDFTLIMRKYKVYKKDAITKTIGERCTYGTKHI